MKPSGPSSTPLPWVDPAVALRFLVDEFLRLESFSRLVAEARYHEVLAVVHSLCATALACEDMGMSRDEIVAILAPVREVHARSPFVRRLQEWPRSYPGDFETVEYICRGENRAEVGTLAYECERYALSSPIAQQHRNKVAHQASRLLHAMAARPRASRVASIACGSCPDLRMLLPHLPSLAGEVYLNDSDADALDYSRRMLGSVAESFRFVQANALRVASRLAGAGPFDLVLAGGLFDYLPERHAVFLIGSVYERLLGEGGTFFFTNIAAGNPYRVLVEYFGDWFLIERSEEEMVRYCVAAGVPRENVRVSRDESGLALLLEVTKR